MVASGDYYYNPVTVWYANDGMGIFGAPQSIDERSVRALHPSDLDGDGDTDALALLASKIVWYENDGTGAFASYQLVATGTDGIQTFTTADLDGDGDSDVLSASRYYPGSYPYTGTRVVWYENDGLGSFANPQTITSQPTDVRKLTAADLDQDGDLDLVTGASFFDASVSWYKNDGTGNFGPQLVISTQVEGVRLLSTADFDQDGDPDVLVSSSAGLAWFRNDGTGSFGPRRLITDEQSDIHSYFVTDLDGDQDLDIATALADNNQVAWYPNGGNGDFDQPNVVTNSVSEVRFVETADVDGDGNQDLLSASADGVIWYRNSGIGNFDSPSVITAENPAAAVGSADLDGDGDMDVVATSYSSLTWYANDGNGNFGAPKAIGSGYGFASIPIADLDGDGNLDVIATFASSYNLDVVWYQNNGTGTFSSSKTIISGSDIVSNVAPADLDNDGDTDLVLTTTSYSGFAYRTRVVWIENDGAGNFGSAQSVTGRSYSDYRVVPADLNSDGDLDLLVVSDSDLTWYKNDGQGNFTKTTVITDALSSVQAIDVADLDGDGDTDVVVNGYESTNYQYNIGTIWYENDGTGDFTAGQSIASTSYSLPTLTVTDLNGDGRKDLLTASSNEISWYENQLDQVNRPTLVNSLSLIRTSDNVVLSDLQDQNTISLAAFGPSDFTVRANTIGNTAARVRFALEGPTTKTQDERAAPYALFGNVGTDYFGAAPLPGVYKLRVTPFYTQGGQSVAGEATTVTFRLQTPFIDSFTLIHADDDQAVQQLQEGDVINALAFGTGSFSVRANADNAALVRFDLQGPVTQARDERRAPYALFGNRGNDYFGASFLPGNYALTATPYFVGRQEQLQAGAPRTVRFTFTEGNAAEVVLAYPNVFDGELFVRTPAAPEAVQLRLQSVQGGAAYSVAAQPGSEAGELRLDTRSLPAGHYVLQLVGPQGTETRHVVKQ